MLLCMYLFSYLLDAGPIFADYYFISPLKMVDSNFINQFASNTEQRTALQFAIYNSLLLALVLWLIYLYNQFLSVSSIFITQNNYISAWNMHFRTFCDLSSTLHVFDSYCVGVVSWNSSLSAEASYEQKIMWYVYVCQFYMPS